MQGKKIGRQRCGLPPLRQGMGIQSHSSSAGTLTTDGTHCRHLLLGYEVKLRCRRIWRVSSRRDCIRRFGKRVGGVSILLTRPALRGGPWATRVKRQTAQLVLRPAVRRFQMVSVMNRILHSDVPIRRGIQGDALTTFGSRRLHPIFSTVNQNKEGAAMFRRPNPVGVCSQRGARKTPGFRISLRYILFASPYAAR